MPSREALIAVCGKEIALRLMNEFPGQTIPHPFPNKRTMRDDLVRLFMAGATVDEATQRLGCSRRWAFAVRSALMN